MLNDLLSRFYINQSDTFYAARFRALVNSLSTGDLYELAEELFFARESYEDIQHLVSSRIQEEQLVHPTQSYPKLIGKLLSEYKNQEKHRKKQKYALLMSSLIDKNTRSATARRVINELLNSPYVSIRGIAYRLMGTLPEEFSKEIGNSYEKHHDPQSIRLIIEYIPKLKEACYENLRDEVSGVLLKQLYAGISLSRERKRDLKSRDPITYLFVMSERKMSVTEDEALAIWEDYKNDTRYPIMISAFGRLKLWNVLAQLQPPAKTDTF